MNTEINKFRVVIIDDERLARAEIRRHLVGYKEFQIVGEANHADQGMEVIETKSPDLIFLDIQMPEKTGFELLEEMTVAPEVVFTTAYSKYAVRAFDLNALDYLVKPIRKERFSRTIEKVKKELHRIHETRSRFLIHQKIFIRDREKCHFIPISEIRYIESLENYSRFHFGTNKAMIKKSLNQIEGKLDPTVFFRINRSEIININFIKEIYPGFKKTLKIELSTGETFDVSSRKSLLFKNRNSL